MGGSVDATCEPGDNHYAGLDESASQTGRSLNSSVRGLASTYNGDRPQIDVEQWLTTQEQERRQVIDQSEVERVVLVKNGDESSADLVGESDLLVDSLEPSVRLTEACLEETLCCCGRGGLLTHSGRLELVEPSRPESGTSKEWPVGGGAIQSDRTERQEPALSVGDRHGHRLLLIEQLFGVSRTDWRELRADARTISRGCAAAPGRPSYRVTDPQAVDSAASDQVHSGTPSGIRQAGESIDRRTSGGLDPLRRTAFFS
jgi:hypothetical protein